MATDQLINPATFLDPSSVTLVALLASSNFVIPDYQRDYSWTEDEIQQLWDDLIATASKAFNGAGNLVANPAPHFLGPIVLQTFPSGLNKTPEVMDGQQRLVTLAALFSVLCEFAQQLTLQFDKDNWTSSLKQLLFTFIAGNKVPRLTLARDDQHYQKLICDCFTKQDRDNYLSSVQFSKKTVLGKLKVCTDALHRGVSAYLGPTGTAGRDAKLVQLFKSIMQLTVVLQMKVLEQGVAYEVFEGLNARGLDLQQADLLKNKLYKLAEQQGTKSHVVAAWERAVKAIQQQSLISLTEFFHFHLISKFRDAKLQDLYTQVLAHLNIAGNSARDYAEDAAKTAEYIQQILEAGSSFTPAVARDVESIRDLIKNKYALTLLISGASRYPLTSPELASVIQLTHHYVFRRFVIEGLSVSAYSSEITKAARDFFAGSITDVAALRARLASNSKQAVFEEKFEDFIAPTNKVGFYVLEMIENHITANAGTMVQRQSISQHLEHIMPRNPDPTDWAHVCTDANYDDYVNRIGNFLVLETDKNSHIKNKAFSFKDVNPAHLDYQSSKMTLPKVVRHHLEHGKWTFESIKRRQAELVTKYASSVWDL